MKTSKAGIDLIKQFEGLRLEAYKAVPSERYYTIGYGHYGRDVKADMRITEEQAENFLRQDLCSAERAVNEVDERLLLNQNQFDALVSFTYNCGIANLKKLTKGRSKQMIGNKIVLYNKAGGMVLKGLVRRRNAEKELYFK